MHLLYPKMGKEKGMTKIGLLFKHKIASALHPTCDHFNSLKLSLVSSYWAWQLLRMNNTIFPILANPRTCTEAGYTSCCTSGSCYASGGRCYCDQECRQYSNCCPDIDTTCPNRKSHSQNMHVLYPKMVKERWKLIRFLFSNKNVSALHPACDHFISKVWSVTLGMTTVENEQHCFPHFS